jgi:hypothetical protein
MKQTTGKNCFATCVACITEHEIENVPCIHDSGYDEDNWFQEWNYDLQKNLGVTVIEITPNAIYEGVWFFVPGYWIASVPSLNIVGQNHAIVMKGNAVAHDPSPKKTYKTGTSDEELDIKMYSLVVPTIGA